MTKDNTPREIPTQKIPNKYQPEKAREKTTPTDANKISPSNSKKTK